MAGIIVYDNYIKAGNPDTPVEQLRALLDDQDAAVRRRLAENPRTPEDVLLKLADDADLDVRCAVAEHERAPRIVLENLVKDENVQVRYAVSGQYTLPVDLLETLAANDENPYVRDHARRTLEGIFLEDALKAAGFVPHPGEKDKLGDLLRETGVLKAEQVDELLRLAKEREIPLGHVLVESRSVSRNVVVAALKAQVAVRDGTMSHQEALWNIKHVWGKI
ncbi:MAG: HEAT repeat domain-containing protein [Candidatus Obscuribacterales bacterium]|nr:HEAT repeat domain-containing protein [Candidatus Obscuribacterales bacterium]